MFFLEYRCQSLLPVQGAPVSAYPYIAYKLIMKETGFQRLCGARTSCLEALLRAENGAFYSESVRPKLISLHRITRHKKERNLLQVGHSRREMGFLLAQDVLWHRTEAAESGGPISKKLAGAL